jgi:hypothetical protein
MYGRGLSGSPVHTENFIRTKSGTWSGGNALVMMMQSANLRDFHDPTHCWRLDRSTDWRILAQRQMRSGLFSIRHRWLPDFSKIRARCGIRSTSAKTSNEIIRCLRSQLQRVSRLRSFHCRRINSPETRLISFTSVPLVAHTKIERKAKEKNKKVSSSYGPNISLRKSETLNGDCDEPTIELTLNNTMISTKKGGALIAGCSPAVSLMNFGYD